MAPSRGRLALLLLAAAAERPCCSEDDYALGEWVRDETATWAFRTGPDTRSSHCEAARRAFASTGAVPDYLRWRWAPAAPSSTAACESTGGSPERCSPRAWQAP